MYKVIIIACFFIASCSLTTRQQVDIAKVVIDVACEEAKASCKDFIDKPDDKAKCDRIATKVCTASKLGITIADGVTKQTTTK